MIAQKCFSQDTTVVTQDGYRNKPDLIITINAINTLLLRPQISVEKFIADQKSVELSIGVIFKNNIANDLTYKYLLSDVFWKSGYNLGVSYKHYLSRKWRSPYISGMVFYKNTQYKNHKWENGYVDAARFEYRNQSNYSHHTGISLIMGLDTGRIFNNKIFTTMYFGIGAVYITSTTTIYQQNAGNFVEHYILPYVEKKNHFIPNLQFGIKLGLIRYKQKVIKLR